jgi:hypothetical protein
MSQNFLVCKSAQLSLIHLPTVVEYDPSSSSENPSMSAMVTGVSELGPSSRLESTRALDRSSWFGRLLLSLSVLMFRMFTSVGLVLGSCS